jgi:TetR/AcrR family transcriptional regulator, mexJK operon transcriptional repressor
MGRPALVTRDQVLAAAREAFVDGGYAGTTLAEISGRLGVSPAALLRHAPTKRALFSEAMGQSPQRDLRPLEFLEKVKGSADPRHVLRRVAEVFVPFIQERLREAVSLWVFSKKVPGVGSLPLPFDPRERPTPPQRNLKYLERYLRRAKRARRVRVADPYAAAAVFIGSLHSYVFLQEVMNAFEKPISLDRFLDSLLEVWTRGAVSFPGTR